MTVRTPPRRCAAHRREIARAVAADLSSRPAVREVWLEGPLACGLAHGRSDIDLTIVVEEPQRVESRVVDGVRVDLSARMPAEIRRQRELLAGFDVTFDDIEGFRVVRAALPGLTRYTSAVRLDGPEHRVARPEEVGVYRRWALADQAECVMSLAEDLVGLVEEDMTAGAEIVWRLMCVRVAAAELVAVGMPLFGDKWIPELWRRVPAGPRAAGVFDRRPPEDMRAGFRQVQRLMAGVLRACWPVTADAGSVDPRHAGFGWLPQRYQDGWFLRRADERIRVTDAEFAGWCRRVEETVDD